MYAMALIIQGKEISIPVLPEKLAVSSPGKNEKVEVLGLGEVLVLRAKGLRSVAWDSFFPAWSAPFVTGPMVTPIEAVRAIQAARDTKKPVSMILTGANLDINTEMGIDDFEYSNGYSNGNSNGNLSSNFGSNCNGNGVESIQDRDRCFRNCVCNCFSRCYG